MKKNKLRTAGVLMTISIVLLLLFQAYWLQSAFKDEYHRLRRELSVSLRETVLKQQIQWFMRNNFTQIKDTVPGMIKRTDSLLLFRKEEVHPQKNGERSQVNIVVRGDSMKVGGRQNFMFEQERRKDEKVDLKKIVVNFPIPFGIKSIDSTRDEYRKNLTDANINLPFKLEIKKGDSTHNTMRMPRMEMNTNGSGSKVMRMNADMLEASFDHPFFYVLQRIQWQLLFAFAMLLFTIAAFIFLFRNLRQQHQLAAMKNDFIANITHELKTPVATVSVAIEALKNFNAIHDTERTKEYLDISTAELQRLGLLVDKVMKLSMFEQDKMEIQQEPIDMKQLVEEVIRSMKLQFEKQQANVLFDYTGDRFITKGDRMHLQSVVFNLLDNALKYSPGAPEIQVRLLSADNMLTLTVSDNGIGIAQEYRGKVFEKFFRVPHGDTHNIKGYGLGLSYVCEVVTKHGGTIRVDGNEGGGSIFTVELPMVNGQ